MQATRQQILEYLRLHRGATVKALCELLGLTPTGVRQHLMILEQEGLLESEELRGKVGRPALRYRLSRRGEAAFPTGYDELANALIDEVRSIYGAEGLQRVVRGVASRLAGAEPERLADRTPRERIEAVTKLFEERGIVADWERDGDVFLLHERTWPVPGGRAPELNLVRDGGCGGAAADGDGRAAAVLHRARRRLLHVPPHAARDRLPSTRLVVLTTYM